MLKVLYCLFKHLRGLMVMTSDSQFESHNSQKVPGSIPGASTTYLFAIFAAFAILVSRSMNPRYYVNTFFS